MVVLVNDSGQSERILSSHACEPYFPLTGDEDRTGKRLQQKTVIYIQFSIH